jgi:dUTPase
MSFNVKKLSPLARIPVQANDGSYELYACNNYIIAPGTSFTVTTGLAISIPVGYHGRVYSTCSAESHNIEASNFCSINHHAFKCTINQTVQELKIILRNLGSTEFHVKTGDPIASMIIHQIKKLPVYEVEKLDDITQDFAVQMKMRNVKSIPGRVRTWFIMEYRNGPMRCREKYTTPEMIEELDEFKTTQAYIREKVPLELEAKFIFGKIEKSTATIGETTQTHLMLAKDDYSIARQKAKNA